MIKGISLLICFLSICFYYSQDLKLDIIPQPKSTKYGNVDFQIPSKLNIITDKKLVNEAMFLKEYLETITSNNIPILFAKEVT